LIVVKSRQANGLVAAEDLLSMFMRLEAAHTVRFDIAWRPAAGLD
jgi:hypothetical protein